MEQNEIIYHIYQAVKQALIERLGQQGYLVVETRENDPLYDSRFVIWSNNMDLIRFTWDGKESVFLVEVSNDLPISPLTSWTSLTIMPFQPDSDTRLYIYNTAQKIVSSLD